MKMVLIIILLINFIYPNKYCYTEEEVIEIHNIIQECDFKDQVHFKVEENLSSQIKNLELNVEKHKLLISEGLVLLQITFGTTPNIAPPSNLNFPVSIEIIFIS